VTGVIALAVLRLALKLDLGLEYDTNANRAEVVSTCPTCDPPQGSPLVRTTTRFTLSHQKGISLLRLTGGLGAKVFWFGSVQDQNTLVGHLALDERLALGRVVDLGFSVDYYDAGQLVVNPAEDRHRDFRTGAAAVRLSFVDGPGDVTLSGGYRGFHYKPDFQFSFQAAQANLFLATRAVAGSGTRTHEIGFSANYHFERRWYPGVRDHLFANPMYPPDHCDPHGEIYPYCIRPVPTGEKRKDWFHEGSFDLTYVGPLLVSTSYAIQLNVSDSFGQSLLRHIFTMRLSARLFWEIYGTLKAQVLYNNYLDPVLLNIATSTTPVSIEDENRNSLIVDLERPIGKIGLAVIARYSLYTNELTTQSPVEFIRHVIYLGVSYKVGWTLKGKNPRPSP
jgi:hypothetical protein